MPHGSADWGGLKPRVVTFGGIDLDEVAARLGSPSFYDRRGELVWSDQFEYGIEPWAIETTGSGGAGADVTNTWLTKGHSLKLTSGTDAGAETVALRELFMPQLTRIGLEVMLCFASDVGYGRVALSFLDGTWLQVYFMEVDVQNDLIRIYDGDAGYVNVITGIPINQNGAVFYPVKFVVDAATRKWVRLLFANLEVDLSAYRGTAAADVRAPLLDIEVTVITDDDANRAMFVDNVVVTQDEP